MAAQQLPRDLVRPSSGFKELAQTIKKSELEAVKSRIHLGSSELIIRNGLELEGVFTSATKQSVANYFFNFSHTNAWCWYV